MTRDEAKYIDPEAFKPERFFDENGNLNDDDTVLAFGFGRRICVGRHMASATLWLTMVSILATLSIDKAKDEDGREIGVDPVWCDAGVLHVEPFRCSIVPRSVEARQLVEDPTRQ